MQDNSIQQNNIRLFKNTIAMYSRTLIVMFVNLYITRVILQHLGAEDYGLYSVVGTVVVLFSFLNSSLSQAVQRFVTVEVGSGNEDSVNRVFNMSLIVQVIISVLLILVSETLGLFIINRFLNVSPERIEAANWVFQFSILTTIISIIRVPYEAIVIAYEKMGFFALASVFDVFLKLVVVLVLPIIQVDNLILYSGLLCIVSMLSLVIYWLYCKIKFSVCRLKRSWSKPIFFQMISFSGWSLCGSVSSLATMNGFAFMLNIFYGVVANAALGIANQVNAAVAQFIGNFQNSFRPQIIKAYASNQMSYFNKLISTTSKLSYLLIFIPSVMLFVNMPLILEIWLGEDIPTHTIAFCRLILICCLFDGLTGSYYCALSATGNIKVYQIAISLSFVLDLIISIMMMISNVSPDYILYSRIATRGVINMLIGLYLMKIQISFDIRQYVKGVILPLGIFTTIISIINYVLLILFETWNLLIFSTITVCAILLFGLPFILDQSEKKNLKILFSKIKK